MLQLKKKWFTGVKNMTIVTPSEWLANLVNESYLKEYPIKVINNGIDLNIFKPTPCDDVMGGGKLNAHIVLFVSFGWSVYKGLDVIVDLQYQEVELKSPKNTLGMNYDLRTGHLLFYGYVDEATLARMSLFPDFWNWFFSNGYMAPVTLLSTVIACAPLLKLKKEDT